MKQADLFETADKGDWRMRAIARARIFVANSTEPFLAEQLRDDIARNVGKPHSPNAWGSITLQLVRLGVIVPTGRWLPMQAESSHARKTPEYRRAT